MKEIKKTGRQKDMAVVFLCVFGDVTRLKNRCLQLNNNLLHGNLTISSYIPCLFKHKVKNIQTTFPIWFSQTEITQCNNYK